MAKRLIRLRAASVAIFAVAALSAGAAFAVDELYRARDVVTGTDERYRTPGLINTFEDVMVKVSGNPDIPGDPRLATLEANVKDYVDAFTYRDMMADQPIHDEQGTHDRPNEITVDFNPAKIAAALQTLGLKPWPEPRPRLVIFVAVRKEDNAFVLASDFEAINEMRDALDNVAKEAAVPYALLDQASLAKAGLDFASLPSRDPSGLVDLAKAAGGDVPIVGSLIWSDADLGWVATWRMLADGKPVTWEVRGVSFDGGFRSGVSGAAKILSGNGAPLPSP